MAGSIGGIAAIASASNRDRYRDDRYRDNYYRSNGNPRRAINKCVRVAENQARRAGYRYANVVDINRVRDTRRGWNITGRIEVDGTLLSSDIKNIDTIRSEVPRGYMWAPAWIQVMTGADVPGP